jgi:nicotinamidase-related amidase
MTLTTIDARPALVVIDLQKGFMSRPTVHPIEEIVRRSAVLADAFRDRALPVVLVNVTGAAPGRTDADQFEEEDDEDPPVDWADLVDELGTRPDDVLISKQQWDAFQDTALHQRLQELGVTQLVLTGVRTSVGVESTARSGYARGYHVVLATDAITDGDVDAHRNSVQRIFPNLGETTTTADFLELLEKSGSQPSLSESES